jgi:hypothetical protein
MRRGSLEPYQRSALLATLPYVFAGRSEIGDGETRLRIARSSEGALLTAQASQPGGS